MNEPILDQVKRRLNASRGDWPKIAEATGVPYDTIAKIAQGRRPNPTLQNVQPLLNYFEAFDRMLEGLRHGPEKAAA